MGTKGSILLFSFGVILILGALLLGCSAAAPAVPTDEPAEALTIPAPSPTTAAAEQTDTLVPEPILTGNPVRGGLLYDQWWVELAISAPEGDHPLWALQTTNARTGTDTWRCKECHGWDYKGVDGAYGSGSHMTGFAGILEASEEKSAAELLADLQGESNADHDFSPYMDEQALTDLALFMAETVRDYADLVDSSKVTWGVAVDGETGYETVCSRCHGPQGSAINFSDLNEPEFVGHLAVDNPWEWLHKVRYGQPGWPMPSSIENEWSDEELTNVLAYAQTLSLAPAVSSGGLLYDKWWEVVGASAPTGDHPLWALQSTNTRSGEDTWRCKECHGWDYKGVDGAYGSGSHLTGFPGIMDAISMTEGQLTLWLTGGENPDHNFSEGLDDTAIQALVFFIQHEMIDSSPVIGADKSVSGDPSRGESLYEATCAECHGEDGTRLNFGDSDDPEYLGTLAVDNPWEFIHKETHGQPGEPMPSGIALGWTLQDLADVLLFSQSFPTE